MAITETDNEISLRDANSSRERPKLEGFDMDEDTVTEIEVTNIFGYNSGAAIKGGILIQC